MTFNEFSNEGFVSPIYGDHFPKFGTEYDQQNISISEKFRLFGRYCHRHPITSIAIACLGIGGIIGAGGGRALNPDKKNIDLEVGNFFKLKTSNP